MKKQEEELEEEIKGEESAEENDEKKADEGKKDDEDLEEKIIREIPNERVPANIETNFRAPVLERVETPAWQTSLEQNVSKDFNKTEEVENAPVYSAQRNEESGAKYYGPPVLEPVEFSENSGKQFFFDPLAGRRAQEFGMEPEMINATEFEQETGRLPFEKKERKYKSAKF